MAYIPPEPEEHTGLYSFYNAATGDIFIEEQNGEVYPVVPAGYATGAFVTIDCFLSGDPELIIFADGIEIAHRGVFDSSMTNGVAFHEDFPTIAGQFIEVVVNAVCGGTLNITNWGGDIGYGWPGAGPPFYVPIPSNSPSSSISASASSSVSSSKSSSTSVSVSNSPSISASSSKSTSPSVSSSNSVSASISNSPSSSVSSSKSSSPSMSISNSPSSSVSASPSAQDTILTIGLGRTLLLNASGQEAILLNMNGERVNG